MSRSIQSRFRAPRFWPGDKAIWLNPQGAGVGVVVRRTRTTYAGKTRDPINHNLVQTVEGDKHWVCESALKEL